MRRITYSKAINEALCEEMERDERVFLLGEDIGALGGAYQATKGLLDKFGPKRVIETPISEAAIAGCATGSAMNGGRPVAEFMYIDFTTIAMDQIVNQAAKMRYMSGGRVTIPVVFRTQGGAGRGNAAQHSQSLEAWFCHIPGLKVIMPATPYDAKGLLKSAIRDDNPVIFIEHKHLYHTGGMVPEEEYTIPIGKADVKREGCDVTVIASSRMVLMSLEAAVRLEKADISVEVVDLRTLVPLDEEPLLKSVRKTGKVVVVHEAVRCAGYGAEIVAVLQEKAFASIKAPIVRVTGEDTPIPYNMKLEALAVPSVDKICAAITKLMGVEQESVV